MRPALTILLFAIISLTTCTPDTPIDRIDGAWRVVVFNDLSTGKAEFMTYENSWNLEIVIIFDDSKQPHSIAGKNTTNHFLGEYHYTGVNSFKVDNLLSTEIAQPRWANQFQNAILDDSLSYTISGTRLLIYYEAGTKVVILARAGQYK